jgi:transcriptional regulator
MPTLRQEIAEALERDWLDVKEISKSFHLREREVLDHLEHIARSASHGRFMIEPASCLDCGFVFQKRTRVSTPGRCPLCRSASVSSPRFRIHVNCP